MAWVKAKSTFSQAVLKVDSYDSLLINWLGNWAKIMVTELEAASWTIEAPFFHMIESLFHSVSSLVNRTMVQ